MHPSLGVLGGCKRKKCQRHKDLDLWKRSRNTKCESAVFVRTSINEAINVLGFGKQSPMNCKIQYFQGCQPGHWGCLRKGFVPSRSPTSKQIYFVRRQWGNGCSPPQKKNTTNQMRNPCLRRRSVVAHFRLSGQLWNLWIYVLLLWNLEILKALKLIWIHSYYLLKSVGKNICWT